MQLIGNIQKKINGNYIPLLEGKFSERLAKWEEKNAQWEKGFRYWNGGWKQKEADELNMTFAEWDGEKPVKEDYDIHLIMTSRN